MEVIQMYKIFVEKIKSEKVNERFFNYKLAQIKSEKSSSVSFYYSQNIRKPNENINRLS